MTQVLEFIDAVPDYLDPVAKKRHRQMRIAESKRIWQWKLEKARMEEKEWMGDKSLLQDEMMQLIPNRNYMLRYQEDCWREKSFNLRLKKIHKRLVECEDGIKLAKQSQLGANQILDVIQMEEDQCVHDYTN